MNLSGREKTMTKIIAAVQKMEIQSGFDIPTTAELTLIVNDHPANADKHLRLLGLLAASKLVISDDDGKLTVSVQEKR
jgi:hypothetical protein